MATKSQQMQFDGGESIKAGESLPKEISFGKGFIKVSQVFWTYWKFATERQAIFYKRLQGSLPWTRDPILKTFKFTNAYRASDRVSQYLIRNVAYQGQQTAAEIFFRVILFKLFNKIGTWELLEASNGHITYSDYRFDRYDSILTRALEVGTKIYSAAYIMPSAGCTNGDRKHRFHLKVLEKMMSDEVPARIANMQCMADGFRLLRSYSGIGDFLAYQFITDLNYTSFCHFDEMEFIVPGPGAKDGIRKCFPDLEMGRAADVVRMVTETQEGYFATIDGSFANLWGRPLQLIDCQNLFCEVDKYSRYAHPDIMGLSGRSRIKQIFRPCPDPLTLFYPPKWGINGVIPRNCGAA
jgi:hypothetical protein